MVNLVMLLTNLPSLFRLRLGRSAKIAGRGFIVDSVLLSITKGQPPFDFKPSESLWCYNSRLQSHLVQRSLIVPVHSCFNCSCVTRTLSGPPPPDRDTEGGRDPSNQRGGVFKEQAAVPREVCRPGGDGGPRLGGRVQRPRTRPSRPSRGSCAAVTSGS